MTISQEALLFLRYQYHFFHRNFSLVFLDLRDHQAGRSEWLAQDACLTLSPDGVCLVRKRGLTFCLRSWEAWCVVEQMDYDWLIHAHALRSAKGEEFA